MPGNRSCVITSRVPDWRRYGQTIFVIPNLQSVIVTTAEIDEHEPIFKLIEQYIVPKER